MATGAVPRMNSLLVFVVVCATGCNAASDDVGDPGGTSEAGSEVGSTTGDPGPANDAPTFEARVDAAVACGTGVQSLRLSATRIGCVNPPPAPCTLPNDPQVVLGDPLACPSSDTDAALRVAAPQAGRYHVEVVTTATDGTTTAQCHSDRDDAEVIVIEAAFNTNPTIEVTPLGTGPC